MTSSSTMPGLSGPRTPSFPFAITSLLLVIGLIAGGIIFFRLQLQLLMLTGWVVCAVLGRMLNCSYAELEAGAFELIQKAMGACLIVSLREG